MAKESKESVHYRQGAPHRHCNICSMWDPPHGCTAVEGEISPNGLCDLFKKSRTLKRYKEH